MEPHAPIDDIEEEEEEEEEFGDEQTPRSLKRQHAGMDLRCSEAWMEPQQEEEDLDVLGQPDLGEYFGQWQIPPTAEIALCRTYANYLASKMKAARVNK